MNVYCLSPSNTILSLSTKKFLSLFLKKEMEVCGLMLSGMAFHKLARRLKKESRKRQVLKGGEFR